MPRKSYRPDDPRQLTIERAIGDRNAAAKERMNELRARLKSIDPAIAGVDELRWAHTRELVMAAASHPSLVRGYPGAVCAETIQTLAATAGLSIDQAKRARVVAQRVGVVRTLRHHDDGTRVSNLTIIDQERIDELAEASRSATAPAPTCAHVRSRAPTCAHVRSRALTYEEPVPVPVPVPPPPSTPGEPEIAAGDPRWAEVVAELVECRIKHPAKACRGARASGARPEDVLALIAYWRPRGVGAWGEYAVHELYYRVRTCRRDEPADQHWPPVRPEWRDPGARAAEQAQHERELAAQLARRAEYLAAREAARQSSPEHSP